MPKISFVFIGEGSSDSGLVNHLESLCLDCGAEEVTGTAPDLSALPRQVGHTVKAKLQAVLVLNASANLVFLHRDADSPTADFRYQEIETATRELGLILPHVAVVPIQATEAWLLLDEVAIRRAADKPGGRTPLDIPRPREVENIHKPKERLWELLRTASELSGRRLTRFNRDLERRRWLLLQELPTHGPVCEVRSWQRLKADLTATIEQL